MFPYRFKLRNPLPELPFEPKLLNFPISEKSLYEYKPTHLEEERPYQHHNSYSFDNGVYKDLLSLGSFDLQLEDFLAESKGIKVAPENAPHAALKVDSQLAGSSSVSTASKSAISALDPKDRFLLLPVDHISSQVTMLKRHAKVTGPESSVESAVAKSSSLQKSAPLESGNFPEESMLDAIDITSKAGQIAAIERSFKLVNESSLASVKHPLNPELTAVEFFPVFPDFEHWAYDWSHVSFSEDPIDQSPHSRNLTQKSSESDLRAIKSAEALLKHYCAYNDPSLCGFAYYLPDERMTEALLARKRKSMDEADNEDDVQVAVSGVYERVRDYSFESMRNSQSSWAFMRIIPGSGAFYVPLFSDIKATKRRVTSEALAHLPANERPTRIEYTERLATVKERDGARDKLVVIMNREEAEDWAEYYGGGVGAASD